ncbi:low-density lipoprotein receptor-related protein 12-like [Dreissena polymorpha]|uniref:CUB domain-containing protein n=1 Tax=Dreissena polymorpha TaxID=45954 RepID=A0A9D4M775_DREPO|nr:low-density lipoprotein receptor-related protein 12-like [Dreissena polymorpha]KAH3871069.1 hypothetical protein DPMN_034263 [Dreissena polymorpha]
MSTLNTAIFCALFALVHAGIVQRSFQCGNQSYYTSDNGIIRSHAGYDHGHDYGKDLDCLWTIEAPPGKMVQLVANTFNVEGDYNCQYDYVELFDGNSTGATSLGRFCGHTFLPISSTQRFLTLNFVTDHATGFRGFEFFYNFTDHIIHTCRQGQFLCTNGRCITGSYRCDGQDDCGDDSDETSCRNTSPSLTSCGFNEFRCVRVSFLQNPCIPSYFVCDGDNDCGDNSDESGPACSGSSHFSTNIFSNFFTTAVSFSNSRACGIRDFTGTFGNISSPDYPLSYPGAAQCTYHVTAPSGTKSIAFEFDPRFHLEDDLRCSYDYVIVESKQGHQSHGPFCGGTAPDPFEIQGNEADIRFISDSSNENTGFLLTWKATS